MERLRASRTNVIFAVILTATGAWSMLTSLVVPVLPVIQRDLGTDQATVTWILTAYLLSASVATPIVGRIGDSFGKKRTLLAVLAVFALGVVLAGLATSIRPMIAARAVQGIGGAILPLGFGILRDQMPAARVSSSISATAAVVAVGGGLGIVMAGPIASALNYHYLFWFPLVLVAASFLAAVRFIPETTTGTGQRIDLLPAVSLAGWLVTLLLAVSQGGAWGWTSPTVVSLLIAAVVLAALWIYTETRSSSPLVDITMMRKRPVWSTNLVALLFGIDMYSALGLLPQFLQTPAAEGYGFGASVTGAGLYLLPMTAVMFVSGLAAGPLMVRLGARGSLVLGAALTAGPFAILAWAHEQPWQIYLASALLGAGLGLAYASLSAVIVAAVPAHQTGVASGMNANIRTIGGSIGNAVAAGIVTARLTQSGLPVASGYTSAFVFLLAVGILAAAAALLVPSGHSGVAADGPATADDSRLAVPGAQEPAPAS